MNKRNLGLKLLTAWAVLLTAMAMWNFTNNLSDKQRALKYEQSIAEHEQFRLTDAYLRGAITKGCTAPEPQIKPQN